MSYPPRISPAEYPIALRGTTIHEHSRVIALRSAARSRAGAALRAWDAATRINVIMQLATRNCGWSLAIVMYVTTGVGSPDCNSFNAQSNKF
jgi:hypothetical protein